mmetsp:Transcript_39923/g.103002  ORF Transcript_39923/g.103002 Transcript_39923/m.103002 type:complete len:251 (-) Transcript_39923:80-832(-)
MGCGVVDVVSLVCLACDAIDLVYWTGRKKREKRVNKEKKRTEKKPTNPKRFFSTVVFGTVHGFLKPMICLFSIGGKVRHLSFLEDTTQGEHTSSHSRLGRFLMPTNGLPDTRWRSKPLFEAPGHTRVGPTVALLGAFQIPLKRPRRVGRSSFPLFVTLGDTELGAHISEGGCLVPPKESLLPLCFHVLLLLQKRPHRFVPFSVVVSFSFSFRFSLFCSQRSCFRVQDGERCLFIFPLSKNAGRHGRGAAA